MGREIDMTARQTLIVTGVHLEAFERASRLSQGAITYRSEPVDATKVPNDLPGFRTMFNAFHHLRPEQAHAMLADAVAKGEGVGVFFRSRKALQPPPRPRKKRSRGCWLLRLDTVSRSNCLIIERIAGHKRADPALFRAAICPGGFDGQESFDP
jgi:hypothetical protein